MARYKCDYECNYNTKFSSVNRLELGLKGTVPIGMSLRCSLARKISKIKIWVWFNSFHVRVSTMAAI